MPPSYRQGNELHFPVSPGSCPRSGALTVSDCKPPYVLSVTTWGPVVESVELSCTDQMTCPCRKCSVERGRRVDAYGLSPQWGWTASDAARDEMRAVHGTRGYWIEAWQQLMVPVGEWDAKRKRVRIADPPLRLRLRMWRRS